jgi:hypothetical protein
MPSQGSERVTLPLKDVAMIYKHLHFSVIPVFADAKPDQAKVACVDWKAYQMRIASEAEIEDWFSKKGYLGVAIVTGRISNIVVLDFDNPDLAQLFARRFPELLDTRIVLTAGRDLPHYYFRLPFGMSLPSRRLAGVDLQAEGRYVLAPPTSIGGKRYRVHKGTAPITLTRSQIEQIQKFLDDIALVQAMSPTVNPQPIAQNFRVALSPEQAITLYHHHTSTLGRNEALFRVALQLRDSGYGEHDTMRILMDIHAKNQRHDQRESLETRYREARATIHSAYSRPPRKPTQVTDEGLPTSVREKLLQLKLTCVARVLDGLLLHGVPTGTLLTEREICDLLANEVGRYTILNAINAETPEKVAFFVCFLPLPRPHTPTDVAFSTTPLQDKKCLLLGASKPDKNRGRPAKQFRVPTIAELCKLLNVRYTTSDSIKPEQLKSVADYRQTLLSELIKRQPGQYAVSWLGERLNVTRRTAQRYIRHSRDNGVNVRPMYETIVLGVDTLHHTERQQRGQFIEDLAGKRYPCKKDIAQRLLAQGRCPLLLKQTYSGYWHSDGKPLPLEIAHDALESLQNARQAVSDEAYASWYAKDEETLQEAQKRLANVAITHALPLTPQMPENPAKKSKRYYRNALENTLFEGLANRLYDQIATNNKTAQTQHNSPSSLLSLATARRLVEQYGAKMIHRVMGVISQRQNILNHAGFVVDWLRCEHKMLAYGVS